MTNVSLPTIKSLFASSGNRCAFPSCDEFLSQSTGTVTGEICHIRSPKVNGPRHDQNYDPDKYDSYENLILLCGKHHKIVDTETGKYSTEWLEERKLKQDQFREIKLSPTLTLAARNLYLTQADQVTIQSKRNVVISHANLVQTSSVMIKRTSSRIERSSPEGSIGSSLAMSAYCKYLVKRYNEFQKADRTGKSKFKYIALNLAISREFGNSWQDLPQDTFHAVIAYMQNRIDKSLIGRINKSKLIKNYHSYQEHTKGDA